MSAVKGVPHVDILSDYRPGLTTNATYTLHGYYGDRATASCHPNSGCPIPGTYH